MLSIIIPVYNAEKTILKCINSIISQPYTEYEIIIIDDGSSDGSLSICLNLEKQYNFIHTFHQDNKGVSAARNKGIQLSIGDYLMFIDSDDYINKHIRNYYKQSL